MQRFLQLVKEVAPEVRSRGVVLVAPTQERGLGKIDLIVNGEATPRRISEIVDKIRDKGNEYGIKIKFVQGKETKKPFSAVITKKISYAQFKEAIKIAYTNKIAKEVNYFQPLSRKETRLLDKLTPHLLESETGDFRYMVVPSYEGAPAGGVFTLNAIRAIKQATKNVLRNGKTQFVPLKKIGKNITERRFLFQ